MFRFKLCNAFLRISGLMSICHVTHALQLKLHERMNKKIRFEVAVTSYGRNKNRDEIKKHSRTSPEIQFKELNEKLRSTLPDQQIN